MEGLQQLDTGLAIAHAVVQQQAVFGVEAAIEMHAAEGIVLVRCQLGRSHWRFYPPLGIGGQQYAFFLGTAELPAAKRDQPRQQRKHHQGWYPARTKRPHRSLVGPIAILIHITASPRSIAMLKAAIVLMLLATIASLFSGLVFLVKDDENSTRLLKALTVRVTLAALTIGLVAWGFISGQLVSHAPF